MALGRYLTPETVQRYAVDGEIGIDGLRRRLCSVFFLYNMEYPNLTCRSPC